MAYTGETVAKRAGMEDALIYTNEYGVLADGHSSSGTHGAGISQFACSRIRCALDAIDFTSYDPEQSYEMMSTLFHRIHMDYMDVMVEHGATIQDGVPMHRGIPVSGGTTLTCAIHGSYQGRPYLITANVGDSDAYLFVKKGDQYTWKQLTTTHEPTSQSEYFRIQKQRDLAGHCVYDTQGATRVDSYLPIFEADGTMIYYEDTYSVLETARHIFNEARAVSLSASEADKKFFHEKAIIAYKESITAKAAYESSVDSRRVVSTVRGDRAAYLIDCQDTIRLSVTRAIGDYAGSSMGVTYEPFVSVTWLDTEDLGDQAMVFMATDGILDCFHMEELTRRAFESPALMEECVAGAKRLYGNDYDDMTYLMRRL